MNATANDQLGERFLLRMNCLQMARTHEGKEKNFL